MIIFLEGYTLLTIGLAVALFAFILLFSKVFFKDASPQTHKRNAISSLFVFVIGLLILYVWYIYRI